MATYTTPTTDFAWPTNDPLFSRVRLPRGLCVITDGNGGWTTTYSPYAGLLEGLVEGVDYFLGGHTYEVPDDVLPTLPPPEGGGGGGGGGGEPPPPPPPGPAIYGYGIGPYGETGYGA